MRNLLELYRGSHKLRKEIFFSLGLPLFIGGAVYLIAIFDLIPYLIGLLAAFALLCGLSVLWDNNIKVK